VRETCNEPVRFKFRGAYKTHCAKPRPSTLLGRCGDILIRQSRPGDRPVRAVTFGIPAVIVMPQDAPGRQGVRQTQGYGAEIVRYDRYREDPRANWPGLLASKRGFVLIPPYDHPRVSLQGQGTVAMEMLEEMNDLGPAGRAPRRRWPAWPAVRLLRRAANPDCRLVGVEPESGNDGQQSLRAGRHRSHRDPPGTIADGAPDTAPGASTPSRFLQATGQRQS